MVTPLGLLIAIIVLCVVCSALMILVMIAASPTPAWYRRLNFGSIAMGLVMVAFGVFQFSIARESEECQQACRLRLECLPSGAYAAWHAQRARGS